MATGTGESSLRIAACSWPVLVPLIEFRSPLQLFHSAQSSSRARSLCPRTAVCFLFLFLFSTVVRSSVSFSLHLCHRQVRSSQRHPIAPLLLYFCRCLAILQASTLFLFAGASTRLPNTTISTLSPLRHFSYEMINSWPVWPSLLPLLCCSSSTSFFRVPMLLQPLTHTPKVVSFGNHFVFLPWLSRLVRLLRRWLRSFCSVASISRARRRAGWKNFKHPACRSIHCLLCLSLCSLSLSRILFLRETGSFNRINFHSPIAVYISRYVATLVQFVNIIFLTQTDSPRKILSSLCMKEYFFLKK